MSITASKILIFSLSLLALFGCTTKQSEGTSEVDTAIDRKTIEDLAHIKIPEGASDIFVYTESGIDAAIWLRLQIPCTKRDEFLLNAGYKNPLSTTTRYVKNRQLRSATWWTPESVDPFESSHYNQQTDPRYASNILLGQQTENSCVVYMFVTSL